MKRNNSLTVLPVILSYGRPQKVRTYKTLRRQGWTGPVRILCSDDDPSLPVYREHYPGEVLVFSKDEYRSQVDEGQNYDSSQKAPLYARRAIHDLITPDTADLVWELDDDYTYIWAVANKAGYSYTMLGSYLPATLDYIVDQVAVFMKNTPAVRTLAFAQTGDFYSSLLSDNIYYSRGALRFTHRKAMNSFFFRTTDPPLPFAGTLNDDVNMYLDLASRSPFISLTYPLYVINQRVTQQNQGGMTDIYRRDGTFVKSMHTVIRYPAAVKVKALKSTRWHHEVDWDKIQVKIISEKLRKICP